MLLKRNCVRSRIERSVFEYFISRGNRQTLKSNSDGTNEMLRNESSSRFRQITSDGMLKNRLATGISKVPEQMLKEVWITKWQAKRRFRRGKCKAVLLMPPKRERGREISPSNKRFRSWTFFNVEYVRGLLTNEHLRVTLAPSFKADIHKFSRDTLSRKRCNDFVNTPINWIHSKFFYISVKVKLTTEQAQKAEYRDKAVLFL
jgi:hypothetical protein